MKEENLEKKAKEEEKKLPDFDPDVSLYNPYNRKVARLRNLFYDEDAEVYRDEDGCPVRDRFGQDLG